jgi:hypothetical protein
MRKVKSQEVADVGDWWIDEGYGHLQARVREMFYGGRVETVAYLEGEWIGMPTGSRASAQQMRALIRKI